MGTPLVRCLGRPSEPQGAVYRWIATTGRNINLNSLTIFIQLASISITTLTHVVSYHTRLRFGRGGRLFMVFDFILTQTLTIKHTYEITDVSTL